MGFARWVFLIAGVYGLLVLPTMLFEQGHVLPPGRAPAMTHPEYYYGFFGVATAWQVAFLIIGSDPARYRPLMLAAMVEKFSFVVAVAWLLALGRAGPGPAVGGAGLDLVFGVLFVAAYRAARPGRGQR